MKRFIAALTLRILALVACVVPAVIAIFQQFPVIVQSTEKKVSAIALLLLLIAIIPLKRVLQDLFRSPSAWMIWLVIYVIFKVLSSLSESICAVAIVAVPFSVLGALLFSLARWIDQSTLMATMQAILKSKGGNP